MRHARCAPVPLSLHSEHSPSVDIRRRTGANSRKRQRIPVARKACLPLTRKARSRPGVRARPATGSSRSPGIGAEARRGPAAEGRGAASPCIPRRRSGRAWWRVHGPRSARRPLPIRAQAKRRKGCRRGVCCRLTTPHKLRPEARRRKPTGRRPVVRRTTQTDGRGRQLHAVVRRLLPLLSRERMGNVLASFRPKRYA